MAKQNFILPAASAFTSPHISNSALSDELLKNKKTENIWAVIDLITGFQYQELS